MEEQICFWYDGENYRLTRCTIDVRSGMPVGFPPSAESLLIIEFENGKQPTFYHEALIAEMGVENTFP